MVRLSYYTDPACPWSWAAEPALRRLQTKFGEDLRITYVMAGMARRLDDPLHVLDETLEAAAWSGMPVDPRIWREGPPKSTYPACQAVKAAAEQGLDGPYLRVLREAILCRRRPMDTADALVDAARPVDGLDLPRFEIDLRSNAIVEAFGADRERAVAAGGGEERPGIPAFVFADGPPLETGDPVQLRAAALAAGAQPQGELPTVEAALRRFGPMGAAEVAAVCGLPGPRARMELWRLAGEWRVRPRPLVCGELWELASA